MTASKYANVNPNVMTTPVSAGFVRRPILAIVGASAKKARELGRTPTPEEAVGLGTRWNTRTEEMAALVGRWAAEAGFLVLTGGMTGVMDAAIRSAREHGALTMSILPGEHHNLAVAPAEIVLPSGIGYARNYLTALACDVMVGLPGGQGTLQEMSFASDFGRQVISWDSWKLPNVRYYADMEQRAVEEWIKTITLEQGPGPGSEAK